MPKLVAVTGATGFIGSVLVQALIREGWSVRALTRTGQPDTNKEIQWIHGDLDNIKALDQLVKDVSAVIHCAATVRGGSFKEFLQPNIAGTENLLSVLLNHRPFPRFLLISSLAAREPELSWYARSKYLSEQKLINCSEALPWAIFRPTAVYGPGDKELRPLFEAMHRGFLPVVGNIHNRFGLIHVYDLVAAAQTWLAAEKNVSGIFELDDGTPNGYSYQQLANLAEQRWMRPVRCVTIPDKLIRYIACSNLMLSRIFRYSPMLTPGKVNELQHSNWVCDNTPLMRALPAWEPKIRLQDVLTEMV
ncbi:NAD(P)-dependent oxidoreductase [Nitrosomonas sp. sh817]|uniref:NAD-dependent epimerase/dehydratase family protein n=1 Tax=Nitrosomonas sp. sh817 TaxID=3070658 RepID=UPI0027DDE055|nr:NAD(P)-dependent oxidoreductase [Nitrosomonas sp. sh817]WMJ08448.1 NAD(P)-dependent oxidoreductase [Nitrosomonas sp. sh817]